MKSERNKFITLLLMGLFLSFLCSSNASARDDWEYWGGYDFSYKINERVKFHVQPSLRFQDDVSDFYYWETAQGVSYKHSSLLSFGLYHLYAVQDVAGPEDSKENRLRADASFKFDLGQLQLDDRSRYEFRDVDGEGKHRYRNRIQVSRKTTLFDREVTPYLSNEFFWDMTAQRFNQNRVQVGLKKKLTDKITGGLYYMLISNKSGSDWNEKNIIGTAFSVSFN